MIGRLCGRIVHEEPTGGLILDVGGVGYELHCPVGTKAHAQTSEAGSVTLFVHTNVRQDALELFGFASLTDRETFLKLVSVPNVGPRLALSVLNVFSTEDLAETIEREDKVRLSKVPGVGKKTAERLVLELRGKLPRGTSAAGTQTGRVEVGAGRDLSSRLVAALTGLGYRSVEAEKAAASLLTSENSDHDLSSLLRKALKYLAP